MKSQRGNIGGRYLARVRGAFRVAASHSGAGGWHAANLEPYGATRGTRARPGAGFRRKPGLTSSPTWDLLA